MTPETIAELRRRHAALTPFALRFLNGGPGIDPYVALACEDGTPLPEPAFDAVLLFAELAAAELPALLDAADELLVCKTVARGWLERAERRADERDALAADADKWQRAALTLQGDRDALTDERDSLSWQVEALRAERDARSAERDALAAKVGRLVAVHARYFDLDGRPGYDDTNPEPEDVWRFDRDFRAALDEEAQP